MNANDAEVALTHYETTMDRVRSSLREFIAVLNRYDASDEKSYWREYDEVSDRLDEAFAEYRQIDWATLLRVRRSNT